MAAEQKIVEINQDEKEKFLTANPMPANDLQAYIWFAVENSQTLLFLFKDELETAAEMAEKAGCSALAHRLRQAVTA